MGSYPGSWCQVLSEIINKRNRIIGIDLKKIEPIDKVITLQGDFLDQKNQDRIIETTHYPVDNVISDMSPKFCGQKSIDHINIMSLIEQSFEFTQKVLSPNGNFCVKMISGGTEKNFSDYIKKFFDKVSYFKPKSSTKSSSEIYIIGLKYKG